MILLNTPATFGHEATRLLAHDPARPQPGQGRRVAGSSRGPFSDNLLHRGDR